MFSLMYSSKNCSVVILTETLTPRFHDLMVCLSVCVVGHFAIFIQVGYFYIH